MSRGDKPLVWLRAEVRTPPLTHTARVEAGVLLRRLQRGESLSMPHSRVMPAIGPRCHELRVADRDAVWRIVYRVDADAVVVIHVFKKNARATPKGVIELCVRRLHEYDLAARRKG